VCLKQHSYISFHPGKQKLSFLTTLPLVGRFLSLYWEVIFFIQFSPTAVEEIAETNEESSQSEARRTGK
jgi:hypothetical protein